MDISRRGYASLLASLALLFLLRVVGQMLVAFLSVRFLPPMADWYSGLAPYPVLLPIQFAILGAQAKVSLDVWRGAGYFAARRPWAGRVLCRISYVYAVAMLIRYAVTMWLFPEWRWLHGTIPIFFHWVLALYLFILGRYFQSASD